MAPIKLYIYDLSNGMAKNLSFQLTGRQLDGIWHTSVVAFGKEIYYGPYNAGPGIQVVEPGRSQHGRPLLVEDMGDSQIDEETFWDYIQELQQVYTGDKYHLLEFNCNSFTNDCVGFLTGGSIPPYIKDLPTDFLSTPFGQQMRPMIDNMYRRTLPGPSPQTAIPTLASQAEAATLTSPVHVSTNTASFNSLLQSNKAVVAFFTSDTCAPCKMIAPVFKDIGADKSRDGVAFVEVNMSNGMSGIVAREHGISATPTFLFFLVGSKVDELKGVNAIELRSKVDLLLWDAFPPHLHAKLDLPAICAISLKPIIYSQPPSFDAAYNKFASFIDASSVPDKIVVTQTFSAEILPFLKARFPLASAIGKDKAHSTPPLPPSLLQSFAKVTIALLDNLPPAELFPLVDLWRVAVLDDRIASWLGLAGTRKDGQRTDITQRIFTKVVGLQDTARAVPRNLLLTTLRLASNNFLSTESTRHVMTPSATSSAPVAPRHTLMLLLVSALLHEDDSVRTAAASLAFNVAAHVQKPLMEARGKGIPAYSNADADWQVEIVSALVEALNRESSNEAIVHRLTASLALMIHLSPSYADSLAPLLEVLQVKEILQAKLVQGSSTDGNAAAAFGKEVHALIREVLLMCPTN
ncbi:hypothetical protein FRB94_010905 [Tulasnella sp. JGI-2019a]|nr:hypothetical protein FRB93_009732 [Tulasnella sp. JGI-2019a]KAG9010206.1 hypothetical protein FRB94_010905 [Tulasnella sp. JGI-2019a]